MRKFKIFGQELVIGKDLNQYTGRTDDLLAVFQNKYGYDYRTRNKLKAYQGVVYGCVSLIGEACGDYEPLLQQKRGDQWETIDHEFLQLLQNPSGRDLNATSFSGFDLWEATASYHSLQGDCFWYMANGKTTGRPREIIILRADRVGTDIDPRTGDVNGYFIRQAGGDPIPLAIEEVLRFPSFNPLDPYKGFGTVEAASDYIATDEATAAFTKNFFSNNAGLSGVLNIKGEVTKGAFRKFVRAWRDKYEGVGNAGKVAILRDSDASFTKVGLGLDELDMNGLRKMSLQDVAMMFKVPLELLGRITEGSGLGRGNIETLEYVFAKWNIDKKMKRFDNVIMFALQRYYKLDPGKFRVVHKSIIPEDKEFILNTRDKGVDRWMKRNEIRDTEGLDSVDGGDELFVAINQIPVGDSGAADPTAGNATASTSGIKVRVTRTITGDAKKKDLNQAAEHFRRELMRVQLRYERLYRKKLAPVIDAQHKEVLANLVAHAAAFKPTIKDFDLFSDSSYDDAFVAATTPTLTDLATVQGGLAMIFAGDTENEFLLTAPLKQLLQEGTKRMASGVNDRTLEKLNATLAEGVRSGEGLSKLKARVDAVYNDLQGYESLRIARTETLKASNSATTWAYQQTGYVTGKQWVVNPDSCEQCAEFEGMTVPLDDSFLGMGDSYSYIDANGDEQTIVNTYDTIEEPPLHPNCRCTIIPTRD